MGLGESFFVFLMYNGLINVDRIFELQTPDFGSLLTISGLFPLTWLLTPFYHPIWSESSI